MFCEADILVWKFLTRSYFNWVFFQLQRFVCISLLNYAKLIGNCRRAFRCLFGSAYIVGKKLIRISISFWCWVFTSTSSPARGRVCELQEISEFYQPFRSKETWEQLQNTPQLICMSLNKNSVYCVMPRSSKPPDTCKWGRNELRGILKFSRNMSHPRRRYFG